MKIYVKTLVFLLAGITTINSCTHDPIPEPPTGGAGTGIDSICFESEVLPIFQSACAKSGCHDAASHKEGYVLDTYDNIVKKGIVAGKATNSELYKVLFKSGDDRMPEPPNPSLSQAQSDAIGQWINEGATNTKNCGTTCDTTVFSYAAAISPLLQNNCVGCHNSSTANGGVNLNTYANVKVFADNGKLYGTIAHISGYKPMPNNGKKLSDCQIRIVQKWIQSGAPNN